MGLGSLFSAFRRRLQSGGSPSGASELEAPSVPAGQLVYAVGDIHGRKDMLEKLLGQIARDAAERGHQAPMVVFLGDYVDRGPDSRGVVELLLTGLPPGWTGRYLKGNHEEATLEFLGQPQFGETWRDFGGLETLRSYGVIPSREGPRIDWDATARAFATALPTAHRRFFDSLSLSEVVGDYIFVHAGLRPGLPLEYQSARDLLWIREEFLGGARAHAKTVVHGHTPGPAVQYGPGRIGIDTGAYMTGKLTALGLSGTEQWLLST